MNRDLIRVLMLVLLAFVLVFVGKARSSEPEFSVVKDSAFMRDWGQGSYCEPE